MQVLQEAGRYYVQVHPGGMGGDFPPDKAGLHAKVGIRPVHKVG